MITEDIYYTARPHVPFTMQTGREIQKYNPHCASRPCSPTLLHQVWQCTGAVNSEVCENVALALWIRHYSPLIQTILPFVFCFLPLKDFLGRFYCKLLV